MEDLVHAIKYPNEIDPFADQLGDRDGNAGLLDEGPGTSPLPEIMAQSDATLMHEEDSMSDLRLEGENQRALLSQEKKLDK